MFCILLGRFIVRGDIDCFVYCWWVFNRYEGDIVCMFCIYSWGV